MDIVGRNYTNELIEAGTVNHGQLLVMRAVGDEILRLRAELAAARDAALSEAATMLDQCEAPIEAGYVRALKATPPTPLGPPT